MASDLGVYADFESLEASQGSRYTQKNICLLVYTYMSRYTVIFWECFEYIDKGVHIHNIT